MYAWIVRRLPGGRVLRTVLVLVLLGAAAGVLFTWVFPAVAPYLAPVTGDPAVG
jgi:hypothetical protein